jgi:hypothetical protein
MNSEISLKPKFLVTFILLLTFTPAFCQDTLKPPPVSEINKAKLFTTIGVESAVWAGTFSYLHFIWYKPYNRVPFHFKNDNKAYLQMDKFGHAYASYIESYIGYKMLRNAGVKKGSALLYGGTLGILLQTPIEVFDGLYDWWGCSWGDQIANTAGSLLVIGQELLFDDQPLKYKWSLRKSPYEYSASGKKEVGRSTSPPAPLPRSLRSRERGAIFGNALVSNALGGVLEWGGG